MAGNATAADLLNNNTPGPLTLTDPDSMSVDNKGQLVHVSQSPGSPQQQVSKLTVGTQLDVTYWIKGAFASGDIYTQSPNDSGVDGLVGVISPSTGFVVPVAIGFFKATGMVFVPNS